MIVVVDLLQVLQGATYLAFIAGAIFAVAELRDYRRERQMEIMMRVAEHVNTREFQDALYKLAKANTKDALELEKQVSAVDLNMIATYFEHVGWLGMARIVSREMIVMFYPWQFFWQKLQPWIETERKEFDVAVMYGSIEKMARLSEAYWERKGVLASPRKSP